jgi:hypothetical protein
MNIQRSRQPSRGTVVIAGGRIELSGRIVPRTGPRSDLPLLLARLIREGERLLNESNIGADSTLEVEYPYNETGAPTMSEDRAGRGGRSA